MFEILHKNQIKTEIKSNGKMQIFPEVIPSLPEDLK